MYRRSEKGHYEKEIKNWDWQQEEILKNLSIQDLINLETIFPTEEEYKKLVLFEEKANETEKIMIDNLKNYNSLFLHNIKHKSR